MDPVVVDFPGAVLVHVQLEEWFFCFGENPGGAIMVIEFEPERLSGEPVEVEEYV